MDQRLRLLLHGPHQEVFYLEQHTIRDECTEGCSIIRRGFKL